MNIPATFRIVLSSILVSVAVLASDLPRVDPDVSLNRPGTELVNPTATPKAPAKESKIDRSELLGQIIKLTAPEYGGREAGTSGQREAAKYIASEFERYGLQPMGVEQAGKRTYFQTFSLRSPKGFGKENVLKLIVGGQETAFEFGKDFAPFPCDKDLAKGKGSVVFAGYGISAAELNYDDFANVDLAGKWALVLRYEPQEFDDASKFSGKQHTQHAALASKAAACAMRRASGILVVTGPNGREQAKENLVDANFPMIGEFDIPVINITRATADKILAGSGKTIGALQSAIDKDLKNHSFLIDGAEINGIASWEFNVAPTDNVIACLEGSDEKLKEEWVVIGAHCDHLGLNPDGALDGEKGKGKVHYGADDNASGTAGLLEIAQAMAALKKEERPKRSILFMAFSGEERGLLGSQHFLKNPTVPVKQIAAMLNMDMIGRSTGSFQVAGLGTAKNFKEMVAKYQASTPATIQFASSGSGPSDHAAFYAAGIPVMFFYTGMHPDYHRATDTWEKINAPVAEAVAELARKLLVDVANLPKRPELIKNNPKSGYIGIGVDQKKVETAKGYPVGEVTPGSPGEKAGLKPGDLIVGINSDSLENAMDLSMALLDFSAGDEITVTYEREGERKTTTLKLGKR
ncbi:MAG TPA: M28 family peptidase [Planctomycetota bacterium]|nr:M28 family peptidase [Planctomycetota bacterium]